MKVKDLPGETNLTRVKIKLSPAMAKQYANYGGPSHTDEVFIAGPMMGDIAEGIPLRPAVMQRNNMVDWEKVDKDLRLAGFYK